MVVPCRTCLHVTIVSNTWRVIPHQPAGRRTTNTLVFTSPAASTTLDLLHSCTAKRAWPPTPHGNGTQLFPNPTRRSGRVSLESVGGGWRQSGCGGVATDTPPVTATSTTSTTNLATPVPNLDPLGGGLETGSRTPGGRPKGALLQAEISPKTAH